jgi:hypothetical protein
MYPHTNNFITVFATRIKLTSGFVALLSDIFHSNCVAKPERIGQKVETFSYRWYDCLHSGFAVIFAATVKKN